MWTSEVSYFFFYGFIGVNGVRYFYLNFSKGGGGERCALLVYSGSACTINYIWLQVYPVLEYDSGKGLPYYLVEQPNVDDKWCLHAGKIATCLGISKKMERKMLLEVRFQVKKYLKSEYHGMDIN